MIKNNYPGKLIVFEGLDGAGSSTQIDLLAKNLKSQVVVTKEPTNNIIGGLIRGQLTKDWSSSMECLQLLFAADRAHHLERLIIPALKERKIVLCDRYFFSTVAFGSLDCDRHWLLALNERFILPDLTILLKVSPKECLRRINSNRFNTELFEEEKKLKKVWTTYVWLARKFSGVKMIDGQREIDVIAGEILNITKKYIS
jgi:dTMP kinase